MTWKDIYDEWSSNKWKIKHEYITKKKESDVMRLSDIKVIIGNKTYPAGTVDYIQTPYEYPEIKICAKLDPFHAEAFLMNSTKTPTIENVIFNPPATIVFWSDKTKTVVKCDYNQEAYDPEKGLAMAFAKKLMGENKYEYYNVFKHWLKKWNKQVLEKTQTPAENNTEWTWNGDMYDA